ncbi:3670d3cb-5f84-4562-813e-ff9710b11fcf [Sclerotinia trifoliorum]|uniref:3670d3cb-5f84-4562-813e-ff9710b11fcf n=1 Tax=Sclerotinia trifoliorum TaxID=28548 RepID=A0A8H2VVK6_9HELO|nr:3670d3cb-5f84-4562-813e-ff9710b11fcf [Sclerotinia trifoliorum]
MSCWRPRISLTGRSLYKSANQSSVVPHPADIFEEGTMLYWTGHRGTTLAPPSSSLSNNRTDDPIFVTVIKKHERETIIAAPPRGSESETRGIPSRTILPEEVSVFYDIRLVVDGTEIKKVNGKELRRPFIRDSWLVRSAVKEDYRD